MADDIKIKVGVTNNVKAGMDAAVKDVTSSAQRMNGALKNKLEAGSIMSALRMAMTGNFQASLDSMTAAVGMWGNGIVAQLGIFGAAAGGMWIGKLIDQATGASDKIGGFLAKIFGTVEDKSLEGKIKMLREARREAEATASAEKKAAEDNAKAQIKALEMQNEAIKDASDLRHDAAVQDQQDIKRFEETLKGMGTEQDVVGRLMGRPDMDSAQRGDYLTQVAMDPAFRRQEDMAERRTGLQRRRLERLESSAEAEAKRRQLRISDLAQGVAGYTEKELAKLSPRDRRILEAKQQRAVEAALKKDIEIRQKQAWEAQIQAAKDTVIIRDNTKEIGKLKEKLDGLLTMK